MCALEREMCVGVLCVCVLCIFIFFSSIVRNVSKKSVVTLRVCVNNVVQ